MTGAYFKLLIAFLISSDLSISSRSFRLGPMASIGRVTVTCRSPIRVPMPPAVALLYLREFVKRRKFEFLHMSASSEELGSTGVAAVNSSDFLLVCLCVAAAVSLWRMFLRRGRHHERDEIKSKGNCQMSASRRSQSPPPPHEQPAPSAKSRSVIVFDEWDGLSAPPPPSPTAFQNAAVHHEPSKLL